MIIGIDFDNTLVSYDRLFHRVALERGLIPESVAPRKNDVRDFLRRAGREPAWTEMQGVVYGPRLTEAEAYPGALDFIVAAGQLGHGIRIVSHKTRHPYLGEKYDLHAAARGWIARYCPSLSETEAFLEPTKEEKLARIGLCGCAAFIDDLPEILASPLFPSPTRPILFDPADALGAAWPGERHSSWHTLSQELLA